MNTIISMVAGTVLILLLVAFIIAIFGMLDMMITGGLIGSKIQKWSRQKLED